MDFKYKSFLHAEAFRRTFLSYVAIALLFSIAMLSFVYRDIHQTGMQRFLVEASAVVEDIDNVASDQVKIIDQFTTHLHEDPAFMDEFLIYFGVSGGTDADCTSLACQGTEVMEEIQTLLVHSNYCISHMICYTPENLVDLQFDEEGNSSYRIITAQEADEICASGCVRQKDLQRDSAFVGKLAIVMDLTRFLPEDILADPDRGISLVLPEKIIPLGQPELTEQEIQVILDSGGFPQWYETEELALYCYTHTCHVLPFSVIYMVKGEVLLNALYRNFYILLLCFILAFGAITLLLIRRFSKDSSYINAILKSMERAANEDFNPVPMLDPSPEYESIIEGLNHLYAKLDSLIQQEYKLTISQQQAQMDMLSAQLNPHFLYNTLERIRMRAVLDHAPDVAEAVAGLGRLYRNLVKTEPVIPFRREVEITQEYLDLMTFLYGDQLLYYFDVDSRLDDVSTPKIWMQPIVENFFKHNFQPDDSIKVIVVEMKGTKNGFEGRFFDNIGHMTEEELLSANQRLQSPVPDSKGIGLQNVLHRLRLFYGNELQFTIENNDPAGICLHIIYEKEGLNGVSTFDRG